MTEPESEYEDNKRKEWIIVGISGVTCSGKTTLADNLKDALSPVKILSQETYFYPDDSPNHVKCEELNRINYEILSALNMEAMYNDIIKIIQQDDDSCTKEEDSLEPKSKKYLILEGCTLLNYKPISDLCDLRYYFVLEFGECMLRRSLRLHDPPDVHGYFEQCVWPEHLKYRQEIEKDHRVKILDGTQADSLHIAMTDLSRLNALPIQLSKTSIVTTT